MVDPVSGGKPQWPAGWRPGTADAARRPDDIGPPRAPTVSANDVAVRSPVARLGAEAAAAPPVDVRKVAELRQAFAEGRYSVEPDRIADAMLAVERTASGGRSSQG